VSFLLHSRSEKTMWLRAAVEGAAKSEAQPTVGVHS
jgi:hypothetical protein